MRHLEPRLVVALTLAALAAPSRAQLGLDLTPGGLKAQAPGRPDAARPGAAPRPPAPLLPEVKAAPAATVTMPELDVGARTGEGGRRVAEANRVLATGDAQTAALAYDAILRDPALAEVHDEARYQLAKSLARLGLQHAALSRIDEILSRGPQGTRYFANALELLFAVGGTMSNESVLVTEVARYAGGAFPPSQADRFGYLLARYSYERGVALEELGRTAEARRAYEEAFRLAAQVREQAGAKAAGGGAPQEGDLYARARFLEGLVQYGQGQAQPAVESFKEVVRLTNPRRGRVADRRLRELALLQLARVHYEHRQNRYAIFYYDRMPWGGDSWLEALWESSYAHYRVGDYEKALGNLLTLQSPYFRDEWFPESWILKAVIYYENCRYPEARAILDEFRAGHEDLYRELRRMTAAGTQPAALYATLEDVRRNGAARGALQRRITKVALTDRAVRQLDDTILEVEREAARLDRQGGELRQAFRESALGHDLRERLRRERARLVDEAGARARARLEYERDALRDLLEQALRIKIEVARNEREALEVALHRGEPVDVVRAYRYSVAVSDEHQYWPYDGEFWRDELGTYTYTLTKGCRDTGARSFR